MCSLTLVPASLNYCLQGIGYLKAKGTCLLLSRRQGQGDSVNDLWSPLSIPFQALGSGGLQTTAVVEFWH